MTTGWTHTRWMTALSDDIPISELNIPGAHNAAAINTIRTTRWACQRDPITQQLNRGIRILDLRLKPLPRDQQVEFKTCHGRLGLFGANEFQPFDEVAKECIDFLTENPGETIIMTIQIDDWRRTRPAQRPHILQQLRDILGRLPLLTAPHLPTLGECRGKLYLINRINDDPALGVPLAIPDNTSGILLAPTTHRHYQVYVQDRYKALGYRNPETQKLNLTIAAFDHKQPGAVLLNFASATRPVLRFVYITRELTAHLSQSHPSHLGWILLDYATDNHNLLTLFIANNFKLPI